MCDRKKKIKSGGHEKRGVAAFAHLMNSRIVSVYGPTPLFSNAEATKGICCVSELVCLGQGGYDSVVERIP
jgi:hypothetical protein